MKIQPGSESARISADGRGGVAAPYVITSTALGRRRCRPASGSSWAASASQYGLGDQGLPGRATCSTWPCRRAQKRPRAVQGRVNNQYTTTTAGSQTTSRIAGRKDIDAVHVPPDIGRDRSDRGLRHGKDVYCKSRDAQTCAKAR